ncbi:MAG: dienelactone hydrolase family protein [Verrucomicrobia bacterium]|nr:dienelactone hydrolase family protein [Verrucomicrobiota bacterium]
MRKLLTSALIFCLFISGCVFKSKTPVVLHPQKTGVVTLRLNDLERNRPLITEVWYPVDEQAPAKPIAGMWVRCPEARDAPISKAAAKYPLILMSHGNGGDKTNNAWLAEVLAANGYIVAACDHYGNTWNNKIPDCFIKIWERPKDISFVIGAILDQFPYKESIDPQKIGFIGYSLGGVTGVWLAGGQMYGFEKLDVSVIPKGQIPPFVTPEMIASTDFSPVKNSYRDSRIGAFFLMAPALGNLFDPISLQKIQVPVHIVASEGDDLVPPEKNAKVLASKMSKGALTLIPGSANHYVFLNEVTKGGKMMLDKHLASDPAGVDRKHIHEEIALAAIRFFMDHL